MKCICKFLFQSVQNGREFYDIGMKMCEELAEHEHAKDTEEIDEYWRICCKSRALLYGGEHCVALGRKKENLFALTSC